MNTKHLKSLVLATAVCVSLSGCVVAAAADLAATTVLTAGKLAVKGTGAIISAAIPDDDDDGDDKRKAKRKREAAEARIHRSESAQNTSTQSSSPVYSNTPNQAVRPAPEITPPRHITITPEGAVYEQRYGDGDVGFETLGE